MISRLPSGVQLVDPTNGAAVGGPYSASLVTSPVPGITYNRSQRGGVSSTAQCALTVPPGASLNAGATLEIVAPATEGAPPGGTLTTQQQETFRIGPEDDPSWADNVVGGTGQYAIPYGQLPKAPFAAGLPLAGALGVGLVWLKRRKAPAVR